MDHSEGPMARRSRGALLPPVRAGRVRRRDLYRALRTAVLEGVLAPGERLPSSRQAGADYGVSRGLVEEVYGQLTEEGFLDRAVGRGTFVAGRAARLIAPAARHGGQRHPPAPSRRGLAAVAGALCREPPASRPFNAGIADTSAFPWKTWQRLQARAARELGPAALDFADPRGLPALREAIARYLAQLRGIRCKPGQVIVFSSAQQALCSLAVLLLDRGDPVWIENPGYPGARAALDLAGAAITPVPVDGEGIRVEIGARRAPRARLAYLTPSHQYPTGAALSLERRIALLDWAAKNDAWLVEDDYDGEFRYAGQPLTALYSLDPHARVLYVGTLSKAMFVSLRLAYAVVPEGLVEPLASLRTQLDGFTPALPQMVMSLFMDEGHFSSHLRRMRAAYGAKRAELVEGLSPLAARGWTWSSNPAGLHLLVRHRAGDYVRRIAAASPLDLALLGSYRVGAASDDGLFLRFGGLDLASLRGGVAGLVAVALKARR
jgi:GntR family transcriptional regulator/MocR family aminotransferase